MVSSLPLLINHAINYLTSPVLQGGNSETDGNCAAGYFCKEGAERAEPTDDDNYGRCPEGSYCVEGTAAPVACPVGKFGFVYFYLLPVSIKYQHCYRCSETIHG